MVIVTKAQSGLKTFGGDTPHTQSYAHPNYIILKEHSFLTFKIPQIKVLQVLEQSVFLCICDTFVSQVTQLKKWSLQNCIHRPLLFLDSERSD